MNTAAGRKATFDFLTTSNEYWINKIAAIEALQNMGDPTYGPLLLTLRKGTQKHDEKDALLMAAARLDPQGTLPVIQLLLKSSDTYVRSDAVKALAETERPQALTTLVNLLSDPAISVREMAASGLVSLTRLSPTNNGMSWSGEDPADDIGYWSAWLQANPHPDVHLLRECH